MAITLSKKKQGFKTMNRIYSRSLYNMHLKLNLSKINLLISAFLLKNNYSSIDCNKSYHYPPNCSSQKSRFIHDSLFLLSSHIKSIKSDSTFRTPRIHSLSFASSTKLQPHLTANGSHVGLHLLVYYFYLPVVHSLPNRLYTKPTNPPLLASSTHRLNPNFLL